MATAFRVGVVTGRGCQGAFWGNVLPNLGAACTCVFSVWKFIKLYIYAKIIFWKYVSYQQNVCLFLKKEKKEKAVLPPKI